MQPGVKMFTFLIPQMKIELSPSMLSHCLRGEASFFFNLSLTGFTVWILPCEGSFLAILSSLTSLALFPIVPYLGVTDVHRSLIL